MAKSLKSRIAALEAARTMEIVGDAVRLTDAELWEVIRRRLPQGVVMPDLAGATDDEVDSFLRSIGEEGRP